MRMKRIIGQKLKPVIITWCCLCITIINCDESSIEKRFIGRSVNSEGRGSVELQSPDILAAPEPQILKAKNQENGSNLEKLSDINSNSSKQTAKPAASHNSTVSTTSTPSRVVSNTPADSVNTGALLRGLSVFLGLSVIVVAYIIFRCIRLNKSRTQMVRKYGVLAHRQDVEMRPLPLDDEDEDDTTVFDASEVGVHDMQQRNI